jgi:hypothetical protein
MVPNTRSEIDILLSCARLQIAPEKTATLREALRNGVDWEYLIRTAGHHGLLPLLYHQLHAICSESVPKTQLHTLKTYFHANLASNLFLTAELLKLLKLFKNHEIPAVPFKGPVLASMVYGDLSLREFSDLDILIHREDFMKVRNLLLLEGYGSDVRLNAAQDEALSRSLYDYHFKHAKTGVNVDIHWGFLPKEFASAVNPDRLWSSIQVVRLAGREIPTLSQEDLLLILCIHGFKHCWEELRFICDLSGLIQTHPQMEWKGLMEEAHRFGTDRILFLGLYLAKTYLDIKLPDVVWQKVQSDTKVRSLAREVAENLFQDSNHSMGIFKRSVFYIKSTSHWQAVVRYCFNFVVLPTPGDYEILELPSSLFFLYYLIRPFRLLGKYTVGRWIRSLLGQGFQ